MEGKSGVPLSEQMRHWDRYNLPSSAASFADQVLLKEAELARLRAERAEIALVLEQIAGWRDDPHNWPGLWAWVQELFRFARLTTSEPRADLGFTPTKRAVKQ